VAALRLFAQTHYYRSLIGLPADGAAAASPSSPQLPPALSREECDAKVADILSIIKR
jgi:hypothetical protein